MAEYTKASKNLTMVPTPELEAPDGQSPYLPFQDKNGDGMPDICGDVTPPVKVCKSCIPNPYTIVSNWRDMQSGVPRINEKNCMYEVQLTTPRTTTGYNAKMTDDEAEAALKEIWEFHAPGTIQQMLEYLQKDDSQESIDKILAVVQYTDFYMDPRPRSRLKLLYSVDYDDVLALPDLENDDDAADEEPIDKTDIKVSINASMLNVTALKLRKGLDLYNRYLKVYRATEGGNLKFKESDVIFNLGEYGDDGFFGSGAVADLVDELDSWLDARGFTLNVSFGDFFSSDAMVTKLDCVFTYDYKIKKMKVYTAGCLDRPRRTYGKKRLASLRRRSTWRDKTAVAYFAKQNDMVRDLGSRVPIPWIEFLTKYTYPEIYDFKPEGPMGSPTISDCIANNLENEFKELGQDIFDEVFSLGDAIAKAFHDSLCRSNPDEVDKDFGEMGLNAAATFADAFNMETMAEFQSFFTVDEKDPIFVNMCKKILAPAGSVAGAVLGCSGGGFGLAGMDSLYRYGLGPLKNCGLFDLLFEAMECLFKGLSMDEALGRIVLSALKAMGVEDFGELFVGLPDDKKRELDALVKKNLASGKSFGRLGDDPSPRKEAAPFWGGYNLKRPWENEEYMAQQKANARPGPHGSTTSKTPATPGEKRTLSAMLAGPSDQQKGELDPNIVLEAYILGLIEVYEGNYLVLLDQLSNFPGAQLISAVIALLDCPAPPLFNPGIDDFIKSLGLPFCRDPMDVVAIRFENPFRAWPKLSDILGLLFALLKCLLKMLILKILLAILGKICEIIGNAICKALETVGAVAGSLPEILSGRESLAGVIRDTICGPSASDKQVEDTVVSLVDQLGIGGAALADREKAISFFADTMNTMTREEVFTSFIDPTGMPAHARDLVDNIIEFDYPEYRDAFPTKSSIANFYRNVGLLIPVETRSQLQSMLEQYPEEAGEPANPSMCSTPEELDLFNAQRCAILEGRMSPAQCEALNASAKNQLLEDLDDVANVLNKGVSNLVEELMPPVFSDPGCDNGILPHTPDEILQTANMVLDSNMKYMEATFAADMLGDGGFSLFNNHEDWGFLNMVLSDTYGNPWTVHQDKTANGAEWVSYYGEISDEEPFGPPDPPASPWKIPIWLIALMGWLILFPLLVVIYIIDLMFFGSRRGAYPQYVAGWLKGQYQRGGNPASGTRTLPKEARGRGVGEPTGLITSDLFGKSLTSDASSMVFEPNQNKRETKTFYKSFDDLGFEGFLWDTDVELVDVPSYGYNVTAKPQFNNDRVKFTKEPRKDTPDIRLTFKDNAKGYRTGPNGGQSKWAYGYQVNAFYHDLIVPSGNMFRNRPDDNVRVSITTAINFGAKEGQDTSTLSESDKKKMDSKEDENKIVRVKRMEWLSVDDSLGDLAMDQYPTLQKSFEEYKSYSPPIGALLDLTRGKMTFNEAEKMYTEVNQSFYDDMVDEIGSNERAWLFGATMDPLMRSDFDYGVTMDDELLGSGYGGGPSGSFVPIWDLTFKVEGEDVPAWATDATVMGISRDMHNHNTSDPPTPERTRVFYLDPGKYGGNAIFPPVYAKPMPNTGWTGMVDIMFPERSPCSPKIEGIAGFGEVQEMVSKTYASLSEDPRLMGSPDCTKELPFDRILTRSGKCAIRGLIMAGIRAFANVSIIKSLPVFSTFAPKFPSNYSNAYAGYIVEIMKEEMMTTGTGFLNPFSDNEFWYAFLEMSVQFYVERLGDDEDKFVTVETMPEHVRNALDKIDQLQKTYKYPWDFDDFNSEDYGTFESMKSFRESKNLEAVQRVESDAKIVLQELVAEQLSSVGANFVKAYSRANATPTHYNMNFWFYNKYCQGGADLKLRGKHISRPKAQSLPMSGSNHYSTGDMLALPSGHPYVGEYHVQRDIDGYNMYMAGPEHAEDEKHDRLVPFADILEVVSRDEDGKETLLGDIPNTSPTYASTDIHKQFYLKKYIEVGGTRMTNEEAKAFIRPLNGNISDHYPGNIKLVKEKIIKDNVVIGEGKPIGITGELGVYYGLEIGIMAASGPIPIARTTVGALDLPCAKFQGVEANSKLLLCLIDQLETEDNYRLMVDYIFSMKKATAMLAIYNDLGLLPSIGEWTAESGALKSPGMPESIIPLEPPGDGGKPGGHFNRSFVWMEAERDSLGEQVIISTWDEATQEYIPTADPPEGHTNPKIAYIVPDPYFIPGWLSEDDRNGWFTSFGFLDFDEWDQSCLRKMTSYMKSAFKSNYRNRKFGLDDGPERDPGAEWVAGVVEKFRYNAAFQILPWFQKKQARGNVFNANGEECSRKNSS